MSFDKFIWQNGQPKLEQILFRWGRWLEDHDTRVMQTLIGPAKVSTIFLTLDHNYKESGRALLFETMIFCKKLPDLDTDCWRYPTLAMAKRGHRVVCNRVAEFYPKKKWIEVPCALGALWPGKLAS